MVTTSIREMRNLVFLSKKPTNDAAWRMKMEDLIIWFIGLVTGLVIGNSYGAFDQTPDSELVKRGYKRFNVKTGKLEWVERQ